MSFRRWIRALGALVAVGCAPRRVELTSAPVVGGDQRQRAAVLAELAAFDEAVGPGRVRIVDVSFAPLDGPAGRYRYAGGILLHDTLSAPVVRRTLRHELCHALDHLEDRASERADALAPWAARVAPSYEGEDERRREAFAEVCAAGPHLAALLQASCTAPPEGLSELARWLEQAVWSEIEPLTPLARPDDGRVVPLEPGWLPVSVAARVNPRDAVLLEILDPEGRPVLALDPYTGVPDTSGALRPPASRAEFGDAEIPPPPPGLDVWDGIGWSDGAAAAVTAVRLPGRAAEPQVVVWDGARWRALVQGCHPARRELGRLLLMDGRVWQVRLDSDALWLQPITPAAR